MPPPAGGSARKAVNSHPAPGKVTCCPAAMRVRSSAAMNLFGKIWVMLLAASMSIRISRPAMSLVTSILYSEPSCTLGTPPGAAALDGDADSTLGRAEVGLEVAQRADQVCGLGRIAGLEDRRPILHQQVRPDLLVNPVDEAGDAGVDAVAFLLAAAIGRAPADNADLVGPPAGVETHERPAAVAAAGVLLGCVVASANLLVTDLGDGHAERPTTVAGTRSCSQLAWSRASAGRIPPPACDRREWCRCAFSAPSRRRP